jgi:hypothetical protein
MRIPLITLLLLSAAPVSAQVKMGSNNVCYGSGDPYYSQVSTMRTYANMVECQSAGGQDRQLMNTPSQQEQVERGRVDRSAVTSPVSDTRFAVHGQDITAMTGWTTAGAGCREPRDELLAGLSAVSPQWSADACRVEFGHWRDFVSGGRLTDPNRIELIHLVPLDWAAQHGASQWPLALRSSFYKDPRNLHTTTVQGRRAMEGQTPLDITPATTGCAHAQEFYALTQAYPFTLSAQEHAGLIARIETTCAAPSTAQIEEMRNAREQLAAAQRSEIDHQKQTLKTQQDALRSENTPAPGYVRYADGTTRKLSAEERYGLDPRAHVYAPEVLPVAPNEFPAFGRNGNAQTMPQTGLEKPPIALPGGYNVQAQRIKQAQDEAQQRENNRTQDRSDYVGDTGIISTLDSTSILPEAAPSNNIPNQVPVGSPQDFGDFGNIQLPEGLEELGDLGDQLPAFDNPAQNRDGLDILMRSITDPNQTLEDTKNLARDMVDQAETQN